MGGLLATFVEDDCEPVGSVFPLKEFSDVAGPLY